MTCIVKHADPQINIVQRVFLSSRPKVEADVLYGCKLAYVKIYSTDENTKKFQALVDLLRCFALQTNVADDRTMPDLVIFFCIFRV